MAGISGFFQQLYKFVVTEEFTKEYFNNFKNAENDYERITVIYPRFTEFPLPVIELGKKYEEALEQKKIGNLYFGRLQYKEAIKEYNKGIVKCPQDKKEYLTLLSILIANRSACLFELQQYEKTLRDINYSLSLETYPKELQYKLYIRKGKCYNSINSKRQFAANAYNLALLHLDYSKLDDAEMKKKRKSVNDVIEELQSVKLIIEDNNVEKQSCKDTLNFIKIDYQKNLGRFPRAKKDINCGTIILEESPICAVVEDKFTLSNCQNCMIATNTPIACAACVQVVFCSIECQKAASFYHRYECKILPIIFYSGASINCRMALRLITQKNLACFKDLAIETSNKMILDDASCKASDYYKFIYQLCRHETTRKTEEYLHYTLMATYLLRLLKMTAYFEEFSEAKTLSNLEAFVGSLILRHLQALQFNAHEVAELQEASPGIMDPKDEVAFKTSFIGGAVYQTVSLFNHSCDPSIIRYNIGPRMIVRTIKPIKKDEIVYENYGPIYTNSSRAQRQDFLMERYWFKCNCIACQENWPLFTEMEENELKIPCTNNKCNSYVQLFSNLDTPVVNCPECRKTINLFAPLKALSELEPLLALAESLYKDREYDEALKVYLKSMEIYFKHTAPPFPDWVKVQQRLRTCMVNNGNKCIDDQNTLNKN